MNKKLLIIGFVWPEPNSTAAGSRMLQLIEVFQKYKYEITFVSAASQNKNSYSLDKLNIKTFDIELNNSGFDNIAKQIDPSIVLFDRFLTEEQFGWRIAENCPNALRILDTEDLHFLRKARHEAYKNKEKASMKYLVNELTKREIACIYRCDLSLIISKYEFSLLTNTFKVDAILLIYLPFLLDNIKENKFGSFPRFKERKNFMTIGNFKHEPNLNSVLYLKNVIWPMIRKKLPKTQIHVYGSYATNKVQQIHNEKEGFIVKGRADNAEDVFKNSKVCLAPLNFGAGLKGKLIDAMLYGTPSITTSIGAEAMHENLPWNGFIADDIKEFVNKSIDLYCNEEIWLRAQKNSVAIINQCYDKNLFGDQLLDRIKTIQKNIKDHRLRNFTGAMLMHHTLQSTKYLSKWIEEKNTHVK